MCKRVTITYYRIFEQIILEILRQWTKPLDDSFYFLITESKNGCVWKGLREVFLSNHLLKKGRLEQVAQDHVQSALEYHPWKETLQPLWETCACVLSRLQQRSLSWFS